MTSGRPATHEVQNHVVYAVLDGRVEVVSLRRRRSLRRAHVHHAVPEVAVLLGQAERQLVKGSE